MSFIGGMAMFPNVSFIDGFLFKIGPYFILGIFFTIVIMIAIAVIQSLRTWMYNNRQPVLIERARVVSKRTHVWSSRHHHHTHHHRSINHHGHFHHSVHNQYFITFEREDGSRQEFQVSGRDYGLIAEGDVGNLSFQGTRFKWFEPEKRQAGW